MRNISYDDKSLEKLSLYARHLRPLLRETFMEEDGVDLSNWVELYEIRHLKTEKAGAALEMQDDETETPNEAEL